MNAGAGGHMSTVGGALSACRATFVFESVAPATKDVQKGAREALPARAGAGGPAHRVTASCCGVFPSSAYLSGPRGCMFIRQ